MKYVAYLRVSTARQGLSGLELDAQQDAISTFVAQRGGTVTEMFVEVESSNLNARPELSKALHLAKVTGASLVIAKLDRLSRNAAFLLALQDSGAQPLFCCQSDQETGIRLDSKLGPCPGGGTGEWAFHLLIDPLRRFCQNHEVVYAISPVRPVGAHKDGGAQHDQEAAEDAQRGIASQRC